MDRVAGETGIVEAPCGRLKGLTEAGICVFRGIAYAKPPVGRLRWRLPQPPAPWAGVRDATRFGNAAPQAPSRLGMFSGGGIGMQSEDCLYLNVWTPGCDGVKRPVMVWFHGGAFVFGAGHQPIYDARRLAARDCVAVTVNSRLGALGFLSLADVNDVPSTGAEGIADQALALQWVKDNIASFGGDPGNVTIFGESAGAMSVACLLASPAAKGLFHKAIAQSGAAHVGSGRERAAKVANAMLDKLGTRDADALMALPAGAIVKAQAAVLRDSRTGRRRLGGLPLQPAIENDVLPERPIDAIRAGAAAGIPVLTGTTKEEWKLFTVADPRLRFLSAANFARRVEQLAGAHAPAMLQAYGEGSPFERLNALMTDKAFFVPATRMLEAQEPHAAVFAYRFDWRSRFLGGMLGACHALELGFVFGTFADGRARAFFGKGPAAEALSGAMMEAWVNFARAGDPGWPRYDAGSRRTMIFGDGPPAPVSAPNDARRLAWDAMPEKRLGP
ncbi:MAG TPA: carboxylesterase/lipase family protein [Rhizomicrobium sp.]|nr:carboxylesterase/lipase family protein [Rhizomicrobium sp.]